MKQEVLNELLKRFDQYKESGLNQDGSILINDSSHDFGECDKEEAKLLVSSLYKDRKVSAEPA